MLHPAVKAIVGEGATQALDEGQRWLEKRKVPKWLTGPGRKLIRFFTGFNTRNVRPGFGNRRAGRGPPRIKRKGNGKKKGRKGAGGATVAAGGTTVTTGAAPVAFGRLPMSQYFKWMSKDKNGRCVAHVRDMFTDMTTQGTTNTYGNNTQAVYPTNSTLFPNYAQEMQGFLKYKFKQFKVHYVHFAPTSMRCQTGLGFASDPYFATSAPSTKSQLTAFENSAIGSCYEDFTLTVNPKDLNASEWLENEPTVPASDDSRLNYAGSLFYWTDQNDTAAAKIGTIYVEAIIEFTEPRPPSPTTGLVFRAVSYLRSIASEEERARRMRNVLDKIRESLEHETRPRAKKLLLDPVFDAVHTPAPQSREMTRYP